MSGVFSTGVLAGGPHHCSPRPIELPHAIPAWLGLGSGSGLQLGMGLGLRLVLGLGLGLGLVLGSVVRVRARVRVRLAAPRHARLLETPPREVLRHLVRVGIRV